MKPYTVPGPGSISFDYHTARRATALTERTPTTGCDTAPGGGTLTRPDSIIIAWSGPDFRILIGPEAAAAWPESACPSLTVTVLRPAAYRQLASALGAAHPQLVTSGAWGLLGELNIASPPPAPSEGTAGYSLDVAYLDLDRAPSAVSEPLLALPGVWANQRRLAGAVPAWAGTILAAGRWLVTWHRTHRYCPVCGGPLVAVDSGWGRRCRGEGCGKRQFPRIDPAMIVAVINPAGELFLAHNQAWEGNRVSLLAGYLEAGEDLEGAVRREVWEEARIELERVHYLTSQAWPFPHSLMLGCVAVARDARFQLNPEELASGGWYSAAALAEAVASGDISLPTPTSIAARIIASYQAGELGAGRGFPQPGRDGRGGD